MLWLKRLGPLSKRLDKYKLKDAIALIHDAYRLVNDKTKEEIVITKLCTYCFLLLFSMLFVVVVVVAF